MLKCGRSDSLHIYNLIAQRDSQLNLRISETSSALAATSAKDSATMKAIAIAAKQDSATMKTIAIETKRDSSAMKAIVVLTMVFLPGTFVAVSLRAQPSIISIVIRCGYQAFLSMPLFDCISSTRSDIATTQNFWIFCAITIPLTLLVLAISGVNVDKWKCGGQG